MVIAIACVMFAAHAPLMFVHFQQLWLKPHYQLFPIILAGGFVLVWPLAQFYYSKSPGALGVALVTAIFGGILVGIGMLINSMPELAALGSPDSWVAAGGLALFASIPIAILGGLGSVYSATSNASAGMIAAVIVGVFLAAAVYFNSPSGATASALMLIGALALTLGGRPLFRRCLPPLLYLLLIVPPPFNMDLNLVLKLQWFASKLSSKLLDQMGVFHYLTGVAIDVGRPPLLFVENACSGISSLITTLACVLFYVIYCKVHWLRGLLLTLSGVVWVMVNNAMRIIGIAYFRVRWDIDLTSGFPHFMVGIFLFALTVLLLWSTDRLLMFLGRSDPSRLRYEPIAITAEGARKGLAAALNLSRAFYRSMPLAVLFGLIFGVQAAAWVAMARQIPYSGSALSKLYSQMNVDVLPEQVGLWRRWDKVTPVHRETGNPLGEFSQQWFFARVRSQARCMVSLDYPYPDFHDLRVCYANNGWHVLEPTSFVHKADDDLTELHCVRVPMVRPVEQYAYLWYCEFDQDGVSLDPSLGALTEDTVGQRIAARIAFAGARWQRIFFPSQSKAATGLGSILQVQLLMETKQEKPKEELDALQELFVTAAAKLRHKCVELKAGKR